MKLDQALGQTAQASHVAIICLVRCLEQSGSLSPGQYALALRSTLDQPEINESQLSVRFLRLLLNALERPEPPAPDLRSIEGGKTEDG
jgi:hypothetical protein